jgi:cell division protein FtsQ
LWLRDSDLVAVEHVKIAGVEGPQAAEIRAALNDAARDMTTLHVREDVLRSAVERYPVVHDIKASADFPHTLKITVNSYGAVAALQTQSRTTAVSSDGTLLRGNSTRDLAIIKVASLPGGDRVTDRATLRAVRLVAAAPPALRTRVERIVSSGENLIAVMTDGPKLYFGGGSRSVAKWAAAARVLSDSGARGASYIDLRLPERPVDPTDFVNLLLRSRLGPFAIVRA